ncbi:MAG: hypothetical protein K9M80_04065 [Candidatus Marinimicrobia bacterium]|nr:hypothetical protein [Candidatus Neomarinimicrobiota bacterium]
MSNNADLIYYCDSYPAVGNGHLKRGLDIIKQLLKMNSQIKISITGHFSDSAWQFLNQFKPEAVDVFRDELPPNEFKLGFLDTIKPGDASTIPAEKGRKLKNICSRLITINTGISTFIPDFVDGIINYIPVTKYTGNTEVNKYFGVKYAPVGPEFVPPEPVFNKHILCIVGGNKNQYGPKILASTLAANLQNNYQIDMILSPHFPAQDKKFLQAKFPTINFHQNLETVVDLMRNSQCVVTTYGNATWEALTMHKPVFIVSYLDFQKYFANYLEEQGYAVDLGFFKTLENEELALLTNEKLQKKQIKRIQQVFKTPGIVNIAKIILKELNVSQKR